MGICASSCYGWFAPLAVALLLAIPQAPDRLAEYRARYQKESDPVHRAKLMLKLGASEFQDIRRDAAAGEFADALTLLGEYRDEVVAIDKALDGRGVDPEKTSAGYKELQISLRESLRQLNEITLPLPQDWRTGFDDVRRELDALNKKLFLDLFPRQPGRQPKITKPK